MPSQTFNHTALAVAPIEAVWDALDRPSTWEGIGGVDRVFDPVIEEGRLRGFSFETIVGGQRHLGTATPHERVEREVMSWRIESSEMRGGIAVELDASEGATAIEVSLDVESVGLVPAVFFPIIAGAIGNGLPRAVDDFAARLSSRA